MSLKSRVRNLVMKVSARRKILVGRTAMTVPSSAGLRWTPNWKAELLEQLDVRTCGLIDVGANRGQTLLDFVAAGGDRHYVGFEPLPEAAAVVQSILSSNGLLASAVVPTALGAMDELVPIHIPMGDDTSATVLAELRPGRETVRRWISVVSFDEVWDRVDPGLTAPVVKIDVEGGELGVLTGMRRFLSSSRPTVLCEVLDADAEAAFDEHDHRLTEIEALLQELSYDIFRVDKTGSALSGRTRCDAFPRRLWDASTAEECDYLFLPGF